MSTQKGEGQGGALRREADGEEEPTCGQELAADAAVPEALAALMGHVAENMDAHARWVGRATPDAAREHDALAQIASAYRAISDSAAGAAAWMRALGDLPAVAHDPARLDRVALASWMRRKIAMQRAFAALILEHAEMSEAALAQLPPA